MELTPKLRQLDNSELEQHKHNIDAWGYTRVERLLSPELVSEIKSLLVNIDERSKKGETQDRNGGGVLYNLQIHDKLFCDLLVEPSTSSLMMEMLNDPYYAEIPADMPNYILGYYNARSSQQGALRIHIDSIIPATGKKTWSAQVIYAIDDQRRDNGCSFIVPGSHKSGEYTNRDMENVQPLESEAGDAIVWDSRLWHGAFANTSGRSRWALVVTFHAWWLKPRMDIPRTLPEDMYRRLTPMQKSILGYCSLPPKYATGMESKVKGGYEALLPTVADYWK